MAVVDSSVARDGQVATIYVEVDDAIDEFWDRARGTATEKLVSRTRDLFGEGMDLAKSCATRAMESLDKLDLPSRPDEFELQLAIKLDSEVGAVLAKATAGAQLQVTMKWLSRQP
jgi:hypothetical protein